MPRDPRDGAFISLWLARVARAFAASLFLLVFAGAAVVAAADIGHKDFADSGGSAVTGSKPESKLWYNDGFWWASMQPSTGGGFFIYKLNPVTNSWVSTGTPLDNRNATRADTLWDGTHLYVASQNWSDGGALTGGTARLYRFSYNPSTDAYTLDGGFPATMRSNIRSETLVIAKDSTGMLWATWTQNSGSNRLVYTNHTINGNDATWSTPAFLPVGSQGVGVTTDVDDISTIIAFTVSGQNRIGVLWSNQLDSKDYFAWHVDGAADTVWTAETALSGSGQADDHLNIKTDVSGQVYAVVKTSLTGSNPLIKLLRRTTSGTWSNFVVGINNVGSNTRPILELEEKGSGNILHVFMTGARTSGGSGQSGGDIFEKTSGVSSISFPSGLGTSVIRDEASAKMNNPTSTKQNVNATTGIVVNAFNDTTDFYWHSGGPAVAPPDPQASFTANPTSGTVPLTVQFTNTSTGTGTLTYAWDFDNNGTTDDITASPSHQYTSPATYTAKLTVTGTNGSNFTTQQIQVNPAGGTTVTLTPDADAQVKSDSATTNYGALASVRTREDPGTGSTYRTYLRFRITGVTGTVTGVKLRLFASDATSDVQNVYATSTDPNLPSWIETGTGSITWNNAPTILSTLRGSATAPTVGAYNDIPLDPASINGTYVTLAIKSAGTNSLIANSKEAAAPTNPPQLVITQTVSGTAPTANATSATVGEDGSGPVALSGTDPETCDLTFSIVTGPAHGSLGSITNSACTPGSPNNDSASVTYTPAANYNGTDSFTYKVNDGTADSAPATASLTITSANDIPTAGAVNTTASIGTPKTITLTGGDVETCDLTFTVLTPPSNGSLGSVTDQACAGTGPYTDSATVSYTATSGTSDSFTYKVTDGNAADSPSATVTITIGAANTVPTADATSASVGEDGSGPVALSGGDVETCQLTFSIVTGPAHGTLGSITNNACAGGGPFTDSASVTYTPAANYNGGDSFTYKVNDGTDDSAPATATLTVTSVNDIPTANAVTTSTPQNTAKTVTLSGGDVETCDLTFGIVLGPAHGGLGAIGNNACTPGSPNTDSATVTYTPTNGYSGPDSFTYKVTDAATADSPSATVSITVNASGGTVTLSPVADAKVASGAADTNYGTTVDLRTREENPVAVTTYRSYLKFDVPGVTGTVSSIKLRLFVTSASVDATGVYPVADNTWIESGTGGITWNNAKPIGSTLLGSTVAGPAGAYIEITLNNSAIATDGVARTYSFAIKAAANHSGTYSSKEAGTNPPQLVVVTGP